MTASTLKTTDKSKIELKLNPSDPTFGILCKGFSYRLSVNIFNASRFPQRLRVGCYVSSKDQDRIKCTYNPLRLAPGMSSPVYLDIKCDEEGVAKCELHVTDASSSATLIQEIKAYIVSIDMYHHVTRILKFNNKKIFADGVKAHGVMINEATLDSVDTTTLFSEAYLTDEEVQDLEENLFPTVPGTYYDPWRGVMCYDELLTKVLVNPQWDLQKSIDETHKSYKHRIFQLEEKGMLTHSFMARKDKAKADEEKARIDAEIKRLAESNNNANNSDTNDGTQQVGTSADSNPATNSGDDAMSTPSLPTQQVDGVH